MRLFAMCMLLTIVVWGTVSAQNASKPGLVANLSNSAVSDGCGCYFKFRGTPLRVDRYMFFSLYEEDKKAAWMNVGGRDVELTLVKKTGQNGKLERVGSRSKETYSSGDITVTATYAVTHVCARSDENCESTGYDVTFVVKKGLKSQVVKAVGYCGC
jgi:hypothetical protein